jgi:hypothetical protein
VRVARIPHQASTAAALLALTLSLGGCQLLGPRRPEKAPGSALWLGESTPPPQPAQLARFQAVGVEELFVEAAVTRWDEGPVRLEAKPIGRTTRARATSLVIRGEWPATASDAELLADTLAAELQRLRGQTEAAGWLPVGFHFDLKASPAGLESYGETLNLLRRRVDSSLFLSATFDRRWLRQEKGRRFAKTADFLVCFLYGQRPGEEEEAETWDFQSVEKDLQQLEDLGRPYLVGVVTIGTVSWLDGRGVSQGLTTKASLGELLLSPAFKPKHGFTLEGLDRQVFVLEARRPSRLGDWRVRPGDEVRVVRLATPHLASFRRRIQAHELPHRLGEVVYRVPRAGENLSLTIPNLLTGLASKAARPDLRVLVEPLRISRYHWRLRIRLRNASPEPTDFSQISGNYLDLRLEGGNFGRVDPGGFYRYELFREGPDGRPVLTLRSPDGLRLYRPFLDGGDEVASGTIEVRLSSRSAKLVLGGSFFVPNGETLELPVREWVPDG